MSEPGLQKVRAIDVAPYHWALWCSIEDGEPFANEIVSRRWSPDGTRISFMLESHNFFSAAPDTELALVPLAPKPAEWMTTVLARDAEKMARRPGSVAP